MASGFLQSLLLISLLTVCHFVPVVRLHEYPTVSTQNVIAYITRFSMNALTRNDPQPETFNTVFQVGTYSSLSAPIGSKMRFPAAIFNLGIFNETESTFTAPKTADYIFHLRSTISTNTDFIDICLMVNGEKKTSMRPEDEGSDVSLGKEIPLEAGDRVWLEVGCDYDGQETHLEYGFTVFSGYLCERNPSGGECRTP